MLFNGASETDQTDDEDLTRFSPSSEIEVIGQRQQSMNRNLITSSADAIGVEEQSDMARAMKHELKKLKSKIQFDGFGMMNSQLQTENEEDTDATPCPDDSRQISFKNVRSESLYETAGLRQKLENITDKINRIREGLHETSQDSLLAEINEQLTDIQDQIEDAENDVENNIEETIRKLQSGNERHRQKIKTLRKEKKDKEMMDRLHRQKEYEATIQKQQLQIEQLLQQQSAPQTMQTPMKPTHRSAHTIGVDLSPISPNEVDKLQRRSTSLDRSRSHTHTHYHILSDEGSDQEFVHHDEYDDVDRHHTVNGGHQATWPHPGHDHNYMGGAMTAPAPPGHAVGYDEPTVIGVPLTGHEGGQHYNQQHQHTQKPIISDNALKILGGVAVVLGVLYIAHKFLSNDRSNRNVMPKVLKRAPRVRY